MTFDIRRVRSLVEGPQRSRTMAQRLNSKLYDKYCSSQNFYYTKEIDNILCGIKSSGSIQFAEEVAYRSEAERREEMLKRYYRVPEYPKKIKLLCEYYKFHEDVPRLAMLPLSALIHNYHDQKRRINYIKITKMLNNGKIDSEIIRNMDPNEDSEYSKCSIASSLLSFLPEEFKHDQLLRPPPKKAVPKRGLKTRRKAPKSRSPLRSKSKKKAGSSKYSRKKVHKLSPISAKKDGYYIEHLLKKSKKKSRL